MNWVNISSQFSILVPGMRKTQKHPEKWFHDYRRFQNVSTLSRFISTQTSSQNQATLPVPENPARSLGLVKWDKQTKRRMVNWVVDDGFCLVSKSVSGSQKTRQHDRRHNNPRGSSRRVWEATTTCLRVLKKLADPVIGVEANDTFRSSPLQWFSWSLNRIWQWDCKQQESDVFGMNRWRRFILLLEKHRHNDSFLQATIDMDEQIITSNPRHSMNK